MTRRAQGYWRFVATYVRENPGCTAREVADQLGCSTAYVRAVAARRRLRLRKRRYKTVFRVTEVGAVQPVVRQLFDLMDRKRVTALQMARLAGTSNSALSNYRAGRHTPKVDDLEACLNALGYELVVKRRKAA